MTLQYTRIVVDENVPREVVELLKGMGFKEVYWIAEKRPGIPDPEVWRLAAAKEAVLLTGDVSFLPHLGKMDVLHGPDVVEYSTRGFTKSELQDPRIMSFLVNWLFRNGHHTAREHIKLFLEGIIRTRRQIWGFEKARRKRLP